MTTVDDLPEAAKEADRLGAQLLEGYKPSDTIKHEVLSEIYSHFQKGCDPEECPARKFWDAITTNIVFAALLRDEDVRDGIEEAMTKEHVPGEVFAGLELWATTALIGEELDDAVSFQKAYQIWSEMRIVEVLRDAPGHVSGEQIGKALLWEGFLAGAMFAIALKEHDAGSE